MLTNTSSMGVCICKAGALCTEHDTYLRLAFRQPRSRTTSLTVLMLGHFGRLKESLISDIKTRANLLIVIVVDDNNS